MSGYIKINYKYPLSGATMRKASTTGVVTNIFDQERISEGRRLEPAAGGPLSAKKKTGEE